MKEEGAGRRRETGADERTGGGARVWGGLANRWQGAGAGVWREKREVTRFGGGEGRGMGVGRGGSSDWCNSN